MFNTNSTSVIATTFWILPMLFYKLPFPSFIWTIPFVLTAIGTGIGTFCSMTPGTLGKDESRVFDAILLSTVISQLLLIIAIFVSPTVPSGLILGVLPYVFYSSMLIYCSFKKGGITA